MKYFLTLFLFLSVTAIAQKSDVRQLSTKAAWNTELAKGWIALDSGWKYKEGDNAEWAKPGFDDSAWDSINLFKDLNNKPAVFSVPGIAWFRIRIKTDSTLLNKPLVMRIYQTGASEVFLDGKLIHRLGVVSANPELATYYSPNSISLSFPALYNTEQTLVIRFANLPSRFPLYSNLSKSRLEAWVNTVDNAADDNFVRFYKTYNSRINIGIGVGTILCLLYLSFFIFFPVQKLNLYFALCNFFFVITLILYSIYLNQHGANFLLNIGREVFTVLYLFSLLYCTYKIFNRKPGWIFFLLLSAGVISFLLEFFVLNYISDLLSLLVIADILRISVQSLRHNKSGAWIIIGFAAIDFIFFTLSSLSDSGILVIPGINSYLPFAFLVAPASLAIYLGYAFGKTSQTLREKLVQVELLSQEKQQILSLQNETLEKQVNERTAELNQSLENLKSAQSQLVQSEKMASLGELTAGIAHEIQNPLNFVNNFSEVNKELIAEMKTEIGKGNLEEVKFIAEDIEANSEKINHHGRRADSIVKGMLQHSRSGTGQKEPTNINALADEYLRLSYHGLRAKDKDFNTTIKTDFDETIGNINIVPQDMGRVLLNLYNNAFYAVNEKQKSKNENYEPIVTVRTKKDGQNVMITVADNGKGIPDNIVDKIFQPFFTTKPTGQGTGLGLSLSYDYVKAHGGEIKVESQENEGTAFVIRLPY